VECEERCGRTPDWKERFAGACSLRDTGELGKAEKVLIDLVAEEATRFVGWFVLGHVQKKQGKREDATNGGKRFLEALAQVQQPTCG
jgi:hypothetical protein